MASSDAKQLKDTTHSLATSYDLITDIFLKTL